MSSEEPSEARPFAVGLDQTRPRRRRGGLNNILIMLGAAVLVVAVGAGVGYLALKAGVAERPKLVNPSLGDAKGCLSEHNLTCAEDNFRGYLDKYPNDMTVNAQLAMTLTQDGEHKAALPYYKRAQALGVNTYDFWASYAISLDNTGDLDGAIKANYAALAIVPNLVDVRGALANELVRKGRTAEALKLLQDFDDYLEEQGRDPYFADQIRQIRSKTGQTNIPLQAVTIVSPDIDHRPAPKGGDVTEIPVRAQGGTYFVPVIINNLAYLNFAIDSGASDVSISSEVAETLKRNGGLKPRDFAGMRQYRLANGSVEVSPVYILRSLKVGSIELNNVRASVTSSNGSLLLGQSFLHRFKSWSIDNRRHVLVLVR
jgi:clan AA aspartic protease (TIGR02281 family)